jgi:hypothetical protein
LGRTGPCSLGDGIVQTGLPIAIEHVRRSDMVRPYNIKSDQEVAGRTVHSYTGAGKIASEFVSGFASAHSSCGVLFHADDYQLTILSTTTCYLIVCLNCLGQQSCSLEAIGWVCKRTGDVGVSIGMAARLPRMYKREQIAIFSAIWPTGCFLT